MKLAAAGEMALIVTRRIKSKQILHSVIISCWLMRLKNAELNIIIFNSRVSASAETRLPCFDENLHIVWQKRQVTSATDRDIPAEA